MENRFKIFPLDYTPEQRGNGGLTKKGSAGSFDNELSTYMTVSAAIVNFKNEFNLCAKNEWARNDVRLVEKNGKLKFRICGSRKKYLLSDCVTTLLMWKWVSLFALLVLLYVVVWVTFAVIWYLLVITEHRPNRETCVHNLNSFLGAMIFSVVTQMTIGFGYMYIGNNCVPSIFVVVLQTIVGVFIESITLGIAFMKMTSPLSRAKTWIFSKKAVISRRNGKRYLICRVLNIQKSQIIVTSVKMFFVCSRMTLEGEIIPFHFKRLSTNFDSSCCDCGWPITTSHLIDESSPLFKYDQSLFIMDGCEIIIIATGISESTGHSVKSRTSYKADEVLWDHRFANIFSLSGTDWEADLKSFDRTISQTNN